MARDLLLSCCFQAHATARADQDGVMQIDAVYLVQLTLNGIVLGLLYALIAVGLGDPWQRATQVAADDVRTGFVSPEAARRDYGVVVAADGKVDRDPTASLRSKASE